MLTRVFPPLAFLLGMVGMSSSQSFGQCDFEQVIEAGMSYYIFSPNYINGNYPAGSTCRWTAKSDRPIKLSCDPFYIPESPNCSLDVLLVQSPNGATERYCETGPFTTYSQGNQMTISLISSPLSRGGRFYCLLESVSNRTDCACGWKNPTRIVGGTDTGINEYPMMAALIDVKNRIAFCGSTIINPKQVITSAHCVAGRNPQDIGVLVGDHDLTKGTETNATKLFRVGSIIIHPLYTPLNLDYDVAVINIDGTIPFNQQVGPACLPFQHAPDTFAGDYVELLGWGTLDSAEPQSMILQKVKVSVITNKVCMNTYRGIGPRQLCTYSDEKDSCQYDSGGPVLWQNPTTRRIVLIGMIGYGGLCADGKPAVNSKVGAYMDWIVLQVPQVHCPKSFSKILTEVGSRSVKNVSFKAYHFEFNTYVQWSKVQYINSPFYPSNYLPGSNYQWTIKANGNFKLFCDIYISWPDVLIIKQSSAGRDLRYYGKDKFTVTSRNNVMTMIINSYRNSRGGRFHCKAERVGQSTKNKQCSCGWKNPNRIAEGIETKVHEFPMMAGLINIHNVIRNFKNVICGATIINPRQVITSAHCFEKQTLKNLRVMIGGHYLYAGHESYDTQMLYIRNVRKHFWYNPSNDDHDVAIVDVQGDIRFSPNVGPACLPFKNQEKVFNSEKVTILGWGVTEYSGPKSTVLRKADVTVISNWQCHRYYHKLNDDRMCTLDRVYDSCQYDSGGPLLWYNLGARRLFLVGIISSGGICGDNRPALNTKISPYLSWIEQNKPNAPFVLSSLISIISLIGSIRAQFLNNYEVELLPGTTKYINSPNFPYNYVPGYTYTWTIRSQGLLQLECDISEIPSNDVLIAKRSADDTGVRSDGGYRFFVNPRSTILLLILQSNMRSRGGRFRCVATSKCSCGWKNPARIADGVETGVNEFPMMAGLVDADSMPMPHRGVFCGATIINHKQVVTAAHCFEKKSVDRIGVLVGDHNLPEGTETDATQLFRIHTIVMHPYFSSNRNDYDIAIITIDGTIALSPKVGPVCLPFRHSQESFVNQPVTLLGWGAVEYGGQRSTVLQKAQVNVVSNTQCQADHQRSVINNDQICTLDPTKDSCQYDSGGPVIWRDSTSRRLFLVGIISWGSICGNNQSTVNTRVTSYVNWIESLKPEGFYYCKNP
ncbi:uncharacterized protein [Chelonus insularis]|uniref:uncharacterized protein n=1 Tax=Chelonus insularis TaxID=460826 RepID=UPI00158A6232|nr:uncharacterized protein LOC118073881 [Chelonus insularis]